MQNYKIIVIMIGFHACNNSLQASKTAKIIVPIAKTAAAATTVFAPKFTTFLDSSQPDSDVNQPVKNPPAYTLNRNLIAQQEATLPSFKKTSYVSFNPIKTNSIDFESFTSSTDPIKTTSAQNGIIIKDSSSTSKLTSVQNDPSTKPADVNNQLVFSKQPDEVEQQQYIHDTLQKISDKIDAWIAQYKNKIQDAQAQENLKNDILDEILIPDIDGYLIVENPTASNSIIDTLLTQYPEITSLIQNIKAIIKEKTDAIKNPAQAANNIISHYYTTDLQNDVFALITIKPNIDSTGTITNMPSADFIIAQAQNKPSAQSLKALQACLEATKVAIFAEGDSLLSSQLQAVESKLTQALKNPQLTQFQSWGSYAQSFIPSSGSVIKTMLQKTGIGDQKLSTLMDATTPYIKAARPYIGNRLDDLTTDQTITQYANKYVFRGTSPAPQAINLEPTTSYQQLIVDEANKSIANYYNPAQKNNIFSFMNINMPASEQSATIPSIEEIIKQALNQPSADALKILQASLKATQIALYAARNNTTIFGGDSDQLTTLKTYKQNLTVALQNPKIIPFQSVSTKINNYVAPRAKDLAQKVINKTVGDTPVKKIVDTIMPNTTVTQVLTQQGYLKTPLASA